MFSSPQARRCAHPLRGDPSLRRNCRMVHGHVPPQRGTPHVLSYHPPRDPRESWFSPHRDDRIRNEAIQREKKAPEKKGCPRGGGGDPETTHPHPHSSGK